MLTEAFGAGIARQALWLDTRKPRHDGSPSNHD